MCGIAGIVSHYQIKETLMTSASQMVKAQLHRGPDDSGVETVNENDPTIVFSHSRLAIIDLSAAAHQPMEDKKTGNWLTFNGEIYNFQEIRNRLRAAGDEFISNSDSEVILKTYARWGRDCIQHFRGIFAFAIWDVSKRRLLLVRDHLGIKPLYFWLGNGQLLFASEVRALLASGLIPRSAETEGLLSFLAYGSTQEPFTLVAGIRSLPAGCYACYENGKLEIHAYWHPPAFSDPEVRDLHSIDQKTQQILSEAVRLQMVSDVPIGVFLSGGIDSTAVAALMQQASSSPIKSFCIVFPESSFDERTYAREAAIHIGTEHSELELREEDFCQHLEAALGAFDQPSIDGLNTYFVSKATREAGLTVALSGLGGDEVFVGYNGFQKPLLLHQAQRLCAPLPHPVRRMLAAGLPHLSSADWVRRCARLPMLDRPAYFFSRLLFSDEEICELLRDEAIGPCGRCWDDWWEEAYARVVESARGQDSVNQVSLLEIQTYMRSTLLRDTDQMSMAHALEVRVPLLDHRLVEWILSVPGAWKRLRGIPKSSLTRPLAGLFPDRTLHRLKRGFEIPLSNWLRKRLGCRIKDVILTREAASDSYFNQRSLAHLWNKFEQQRVSWSRVWAIFILKMWFHRHLN